MIHLVLLLLHYFHLHQLMRAQEQIHLNHNHIQLVLLQLLLLLLLLLLTLLLIQLFFLFSPSQLAIFRAQVQTHLQLLAQTAWLASITPIIEGVVIEPASSAGSITPLSFMCAGVYHSVLTRPYGSVDPTSIVSNMTHYTPEQQSDIQKLLIQQSIRMMNQINHAASEKNNNSHNNNKNRKNMQYMAHAQPTPQVLQQ